MNRPGIGPQRLGGIPGGFATQPQASQHRPAANRLPPSGKIPSNGATWAFGGGLNMGGAGVGNSRSSNGPMTSFAQTIGGSSQGATQLDPSEFPSLSTNQSQPSQTAWTASGTRNAGPSANMRTQQSSIPSQQHLNPQHQAQQQQDDLFSSSSQISSSAAFRFGSQNAVGQSSQPSTAEEFPPLNRNANGEIGQDRNPNMLQNLGFGAQSNRLSFGAPNPAPQSHRSNGLLSALSGSNRGPVGNRVTSPGGMSAVSSSRSPVEANRQGLADATENSSNSIPSTQFGASNLTNLGEESATLGSLNVGSALRQDGVQQQSVPSIPHPQTIDSELGPSQDNSEENTTEIEDPLSHMTGVDKFGIKGFSFMMKNFPDYASLITGSDISTLGFDMNTPSPELFSSQVFSLWDNEPARPAVPRFTIPECYQVMNTAPLETKMSNFSDEALIFMFYTNPNDLQQVMAAQELHNRNWRYHKKLQLWLTKDDMMVPQTLGNGTERGYYIFFDLKLWRKDRRELTLIYDDLENLPNGPRVPLV